MNDPSQQEIDDELLSAYLDDELSAEECARVENRLALDPDARLSLEQLRNVSHSVRDLPTERIGRDLRETILRRTSAASRVVSDPEATARTPIRIAPTAQSPVPSPQLPSVTIGRTMRGWVWASAAVAAAVLIMMLQPGDEQNADLPNVAQNDNARIAPSTSINRELAESQPADRPRDGQLAPAPTMPESQTPETPAAAPQEFAATGQAVNAPRARTEAATKDRPPASDLFVTDPRGAVEEKADAASAPLPPAGEAIIADDKPVVVRLLARRAAIESNAFEALLRKNRVDLEPTEQLLDAEGAVAARETAPAAAVRIKQPPADVPATKTNGNEFKDGSPVAAATKQSTQENDNIELVLVEAPSSTIFSCMNELNSDADNFLGISVDDATPTDKRETETAPVRKQVAELRKFNRGIVPTLHDTLSREELRYFYSADDVAVRHDQPGYYVETRDFDRGQKAKSHSLETERDSDRGRALRLRLRATGDSEDENAASDVAAFGTSPAADAKYKRWSSVNELAERAAPERDRMQVLFVIRSSDDEPAPSLKAKNQAQ